MRSSASSSARSSSRSFAFFALAILALAAGCASGKPSLRASVLYATRELPPGATRADRALVRDTLIVITSDPDAPFEDEALFRRRDFNRRSGLGTLVRIGEADMAAVRDALAAEGFFDLPEGGEPADRAPPGQGRNTITWWGPEGRRTVAKRRLENSADALARFTRIEKLLIEASQVAPVIR